MIRIASPALVPLILACGCARIEGAEPLRPPPGQVETSELADFDSLESGRQKLIETALEQAASLKLNRYLFGSADPDRGGFDCSGAVCFLLRKIDLEPPRSSASQFQWVKDAGNLHEIPQDAGSLEHPSLARLKPGDLLFWSGTYIPRDGRIQKITHVQIYLGREKSDGRPVMIGSSDGRSYRGSARCGFGVYDFRLPRKGSSAKLVGYGTPPGLLR